MSGLRHKTLHLQVKSAGAPTEDQLSAIRTYTLADIPAEKLYVRTFALAHNAIDRDDEAFDDALLADFARTLPSKGLFIRHPTGWDGDSGPGKGRWFAAELQHMTQDAARTLLRAPDLVWPPGITTATILMASAYLVRTAGNSDLLDEIDAGIVSDVSIGFTAKSGGPLIDEEGREMRARRITSPGEALEGSLVWLGAQPGARAIKGAKPTPEEKTMTLEEELAAEKAKNKDLQKQLDESAPQKVIVGLRTAFGDNAHLLDKPEALASDIKAIKAYREDLIDTIVAGERHLGLCGDDEEAVKTAKAIYAGDTTERLQRLAKHYAARVPAGSRMPASDPNARQELPAQQGKGAFSDNPALGGTAA
ncbi:hypothetical protein [Pseudoxanthomonas sp. USHLN014]|uniref:hypothetical protein n=1 Tax=Pseudoxanthomonas sp. USHLN014 TaxID=3081297 RepID=UPI00301BCEEE